MYKYPERVDYESSIWHKVPEVHQKEMSELKNSLTFDEDQLLMLAHKKYDNEDKKRVKESIKTCHGRYYFLLLKYGLINEAKNWVKVKYGSKIFKVVEKMQKPEPRIKIHTKQLECPF